MRAAPSAHAATSPPPPPSSPPLPSVLRRLSRRAALALAAAAAVAAAAPAAAAPDAKLAAASALTGVAFLGTVQAAGATPSVPVDKTSAVVRVDLVVEAPAELGDLAGRDVTVRFLAAPPAAGGKVALLTHLYWAGASLGLAEVAPLPPGDAAAAAAALAEARKAEADRRLAARLATSPLVVAGTVEAIEAPRPKVPASEHDPLWTEATLRVEAVGKGSVGGAVIVYFARSQDTTWAAAPKLRVGQQGVFVLQDGAALARFAVKGPVLLTSDDVQPRDATSRLKALLAAAPAPAPAPAAKAPAAPSPKAARPGGAK